MKSQRAYAEHVLQCISRVQEDSAYGREAVFASRTLQDAILRNLQILCESTQRLDERYKLEHPEITSRRVLYVVRGTWYAAENRDTISTYRFL